jgi:DNA ligase-1
LQADNVSKTEAFMTQEMSTDGMQRRSFHLHALVFLTTAAGFAPDLRAKSAPGVLLANNAPAGVDPAPYLVSEKYDGVRALWGGRGSGVADDGVLRFRSGRPIAAPAWFLARLPATALDGELWMGRGRFDAVSGAARRTEPQDAEWKQVQFMVFELPNGEGSFTQRVTQLQGIVKDVGWPQLQAVVQTRVANHAALQARLKSVTANGGEGLMLHLASAPVASGRSDVLLKLKPVQDAEAVVVGHVPGKGKYAGMLGALEVKTANGQTFKLGTGLSDAQRQDPPPIGSTVTYTYRAITPSGKPRFASFLRMHQEG